MRDHLREKVIAAFPLHPRGHEVDFWLSLLALRDFDKTYGKRLPEGTNWLIVQKNSGNVAIGRNHICRVFLEETTADWLWFIDTDQTFDPDLLERMVASADPVERPILSALIMAERTERDDPIGPACINLEDHDGVILPASYNSIPAAQHWRVGATGSGCVLIHRSVLQAMWDTYQEHSFPFFEYSPWKRHMPDGTVVPGVLGEDYTFAVRAQALGFSCWVDTTIEAGHVKSRTLFSSDFWASHPREAAERWAQVPAANVAIIPFRNKWKMTRALVEQIAGDCDLVLLMNNGSDIDETQRVAAFTRKHDNIVSVDCKGLNIHEMWNQGAEMALEQYQKANLAFLNNDLDAGPNMVGLLGAALRAAPEDLVAVCPNYDGREGDGIDRLKGIYADGNGDGLAGFAYMVKSEFFQLGYRFPEDLQWWYGDNDLVLTIEATGGWCGMVHAATVEHLDGGSATIGAADDYANSPQGQADRAAFIKKWGLKERAS